MKLSNPVDISLSAFFEAETKAAANEQESEKLVIRGFANTVTRDRAGDVIPKDAWLAPSAMTNYKKNPIILAFHNHSKPIGKMVDYEVTDAGLLIEAEISKADMGVYNLIKDGILKTFSVGFRILDAEWKKNEDIYLIKELELYEISVVSVPCNQDSVFEVAKSLNASDYELFRKQLRGSDSQPNNEPDVLEKLALALGIRKEN
ncbi:capsid and scaffold protein [Vibrio phage JSF12]|uniref:Capsid and scaffold protein n=2 Tax=Jesfedecavirus TaxID=2560156 RepID=A0A2D0Z6D2_9CAUD|nr:head maturation protease [Vibrio phage JSF10]YP_009794789.1 head maturation protease [Vibrio phage JSF12]ASV43475.1 capsid and scaffold protein [Vibrio phage JSF10]ASV43624.1 capsid and scaffold protein [Vibrio phage JSF12]